MPFIAKFSKKISALFNNQVVINSSWGGISQLLQGFLLSLYFIIIARHYSTNIFANFIIANVLYQLISAFSSLGLSQWFIREITGLEEKSHVVNKFFKLQIYSGLTFYFINIALGLLLYDDRQIRFLTLFFGINIIFDNLINAIKCINIAGFRQKNTFVILSVEAFLKFAVTCLLFIFPFSIITLSAILVIIRFITLNLFLNLGSSRLVNLKMLFHEKVPFGYIKTLLRLNWPFIIIGSISIINWRISTVIISKILERKDVADFEISFRVFSLAQMAPLVVSTTVFPVLINYFKNNNISDFVAFFRKIYVSYFMYGLLAFTFIFSFIDFILPLVFGPNYSGTGVYTKQMFLTILIFPTAFLQANVLIAMKLEKLDMWYNIIILCSNLVFCAVGLLFFKSLMIINLSIFFSFIIFHVLQDIVLIRKKISSIWHTVEFYGLTLILTGGYVLLSRIINPVVLFTAFWMVLTGLYLFRNKIMGRTKIRLVLESIRSFARSYPR